MATDLREQLNAALSGAYVIEHELGRGGMAAVFVARDLKHDRSVALKVLHGDVTAVAGRERFLREIRIAARLQHPHIVPLYDSGEAGGLRYFVMPLIDGPSLRQRLEESERLPLEEVLRIVEQVARALDYAHANGIIHRDIKPENILLFGGHAMIADFGIARPLVETNASSAVTEVGLAVGTPFYMSPEQSAGERVVDGRSDQYALACVAYELLAGRPPFTGRTAQAVIAQHFVAPVPALELGSDVASGALTEVIARALAKEPAARFATTVEFATALRAASTRSQDDSPATTRFGSRSSGSIPRPPSPIIGRDETLAEAIGLLCRDEVQLVTFTGPGGTGKTRLALEVGGRLRRSFDGGAWFVSLAELTGPESVPAAVAQAFGLQDEGSASVPHVLAKHLGGRRALLMLDNFEQVVEAAPWVSELLARVPTLKVLVTTRVVLRIRGEHEFPVPPLAIPNLESPGETRELESYPSLQLFAQRAMAAEPSFTLDESNAETVAKICVRLDGLPLAIELAAARVKLLPPRAMLARLGDRLRFLTGGARDLPERHQTLRQAIAWSYELLGAAERPLFTRLGVFAGGCTIEAAEAVSDVDGSLGIDVLDGIGALLDASLLQRDRRDGQREGTRVRMLETIREFALEELERDPQSVAIRDRHRDWFLDLARRAAPKLTGAQQETWLAALASEHANLRAAIDYTIQHGDAERTLAFCAALWRYWLVRGYLREGGDKLDRALALPGGERLAALRAEALSGAGTLRHNVGDVERAASHLSAALELRRHLNDTRGVARALADLGWLAWRRSEYPEARRLSLESLELSRTLGDKRLIALALSNLGWTSLNEGDFASARKLFEQALKLRKELADRRGTAFMLMGLQFTAQRSGDHRRALALAEEVLPIYRAVGDLRLYASALAGLGEASFGLGDVRRAQSVLESEVLPIHRQSGDRWALAWALGTLSRVLCAQGDLARADALAAESLEIRRAIHDRFGTSESLVALALIARRRGDEAHAHELLGESLALRREIGDRAGIAECERELGAGRNYELRTANYELNCELRTAN